MRVRVRERELLHVLGVDRAPPPEVSHCLLQWCLSHYDLSGVGRSSQVAGVDEVRAHLLKHQLQLHPGVGWREGSCGTTLAGVARQAGWQMAGRERERERERERGGGGGGGGEGRGGREDGGDEMIQVCLACHKCFRQEGYVT